jgi:hypothetical protein
MKAQKPAEGILKTNEWGNSKFYHVVCECGSIECAHDICIEADDINVEVDITMTLRSNFWQLNRWKQIWQILTKGYIQIQSNLVLNEQAALNYSETLKSAIKDVKYFRDENNKKKPNQSSKDV